MAKAKYRDRLTAERLRQVLNYDPATGIFTWKELPPSTYIVKVGDVAGGPDGHRGHVRIKVDGYLFYAHCLAWLWMTGAWPKDQVDHRNTIHGDNRWENLREGSPFLNAQNRRRPYANSKTGKLGVGYSRLHRKFRARIMVDGDHRHLGYYCTADQAHAAYVAAKRELHPGGTI